MKDKHKVTVIIPCYNEEASIAKVLRGFYTKMLAKEAFDFDLLVIDNNSTDDTASIAEQAGARVINEPKVGKGNAMKTGFKNVARDADYVVMLDGDNTYRPEEVLRMLEPLVSNFCDVVVGSRLGGKMNDGVMPHMNRAGNWLYTHLVRIIYKLNITDVLSGYFAWKREAIDALVPYLRSDGFAIEMEMITKMSRMGLEVYSVPISYDERGGQSNLRPIHDGIKILRMFYTNLKWHYGQDIEEAREEA